MLVLRADLSGDPTFRELLGRVREAALGAYEHQDLPFERLVEALQPERDPSRTPLFQVMFVLQNNQLPDVGPERPDARARSAQAGTGTAKFDLTLAMAETPDGFVGSFEYATDLFDAATIERHARPLPDPARGRRRRPRSRRVSELSILADGRATADPRPRGTRPTPPSPPALTLHDLFEAQAARTPDAEAAVVRRAVAHLSRAERAGRTGSRTASARLGVGPDVAGRARDGAVARAGRRPARHPQGRRRLRAARPGVPATGSRHARRRRCPAADRGGLATGLPRGGDRRSSPRRRCGRAPARAEPRRRASSPRATRPTSSTPPARRASRAGVVVAAPVGREPHARRGRGCSASGPATGSSSSRRSASTSPSRRCSRPGRPGRRSSSAARTIPLDPAAVRARGSASRGSPSSTCRRPSGTPGSTAWPRRARALPEALRLVVVGGEEALPSAFATLARRSAATASAGSTRTGRPRRPSIATAFEPAAGDGRRRRCRSGRPIANAQAYVLDAQAPARADRRAGRALHRRRGRRPRLPRPARR